MNLSNEAAPRLPDELQKAIDNAKNVLTITEQETKRLAILAKDQESIIRGLLDRKAVAEEEANRASAALSKLEYDVKTLQIQLNDKLAELNSVMAELSKSNVMLDGVNEAKEKVKEILRSLE